MVRCWSTYIICALKFAQYFILQGTRVCEATFDYFAAPCYCLQGAVAQYALSTTKHQSIKFANKQINNMECTLCKGMSETGTLATATARSAHLPVLKNRQTWEMQP